MLASDTEQQIQETAAAPLHDMQIIAQSRPGPLRPHRTRVLAPDDMPQPAREHARGLLHLESTLKEAAPEGGGLIAASLRKDGESGLADKPEIDSKELQKAIIAVAGKNVSGLGIAAGSWQLSSLAATTSEAEMVKTLVANNVHPLKAPAYAKDILQLLNNPAVRSLLVGVSAGALTYTVVEKTSWSSAAKWWTVILVGSGAVGLFWLLRDMGVAA